MGVAGKMDRRVQFRRAVLVDNGLEAVEVWQDHGDPVAAQKTDVSDGERWRAAEVQASISTRFLIRSSTFARDLTARDMLLCEGRAYTLTGIKEAPGGRRAFLEISAVARND